MKLLFLDFDGVLNHRGWFDCKKTRVDDGGSWRLMHELPYLKRLLKDEGVKAKVIGKTPNLWQNASEHIVVAEPRGHEIHAWIEGANMDAMRRGACGTVTEGVVILDDDTDMACMAPWHVKTEFDTGLLHDHVTRAVELLNQPFTLPTLTLPDHG